MPAGVEMFEVAERDDVRDRLIALARGDGDVAGAALVGSAARDAEDRWSDIDLALQLAGGVDEPSVVQRWTRWIDDEYGIADTLDVRTRDDVRYRVFLLESSLQVDVSFWPRDLFRATEDAFRLVFGTANEPTTAPPPSGADAIGTAWLYALHARSAIARGRTWQAVTMLDGLRDQVVVLLCLHRGPDHSHGRGVDRLPAADLDALAAGRACSLDVAELGRSWRALLEQYLLIADQHDAARTCAVRGALG